MSLVSVETRDPVVVLTLDRPKANAFSPELAPLPFEAHHHTISRCSQDSGARTIPRQVRKPALTLICARLEVQSARRN